MRIRTNTNAAHGIMVGHVTPEAADGGPIALVQNGDKIQIDTKKKKISLLVSESELQSRREQWKAPPSKHTGTGLLKKYTRCVESAHYGAVTH